LALTRGSASAVTPPRNTQEAWPRYHRPQNNEACTGEFQHGTGRECIIPNAPESSRVESKFKSDATKGRGEQHHHDAEHEEDDRDIRTVGWRNRLKNLFQFRHISSDAGHRHCESDDCPKR
jgi:hypothetical protein